MRTKKARKRDKPVRPPPKRDWRYLQEHANGSDDARAKRFAGVAPVPQEIADAVAPRKPVAATTCKDGVGVQQAVMVPPYVTHDDVRVQERAALRTIAPELCEHYEAWRKELRVRREALGIITGPHRVE